MTCARCGAGNRAGQRFCTTCGTPLARRCPSCAAICDAQARFCGECGTGLPNPASPIPVRPGGPSETERKFVSVLFVDLVGFTAASDRADPEDVHAILAPYHARAKSEIERFGGLVQKFIGDAVVATFGVPSAREDDAERAVRAGLCILEGLEAEGLEARAAVNTGEALVLVDADPETGAHFLAGDAVNTAARLQALAPAGGLVVGESTYRGTRQRIDYEPLEPVAVKGKTEAVAIWRATGARGRASIDASDAAEARAVAFVGRTEELKQLRDAMRTAITESQPRAVTILGEPGVGKSRLVGELRSVLDEERGGVTWLVGRCLPYGDGVGFWALGEIVKAEAGILESDGQDRVDEALSRAVEIVPGDDAQRQWVAGQLATLVGAGHGSPGGAAGRAEAFTAWRTFLESVATRRPLVLAVEDLHWADAGLVDFLSHLVDHATDVPLLVVATARPDVQERHPGWLSGTGSGSAISLAPLGRDETAHLISGLLSGALLPAETQAALIQRTGGNPLFAEELVGMVTERGILERSGGRWRLASGAEIPVPETIESLIASRLDDLSRMGKALLQDAAVIGEVFWAGGVAAMQSTEERDVLEVLHALHGKGLVRPVRESSVAGHVEYSFAHALVRDVAYRQIPRAARARKHCAAARFIESIDDEHVGDHVELLAHHWLRALELARAARDDDDAGSAEGPARRYLEMAAERMVFLDPDASAGFCRQALELTPPGHPRRGEILLTATRAALAVGDYAEAIRQGEEALAEFRAAGDVLGQGRALLKLDAAVWGGKEDGPPKRKVEEAITLLETVPPSAPLADAYRAMAGYMMISGSPREGVMWADRSLALAWELGLDDVAVRVRSIRGMARVKLEDNGGLEDLRDALAQSVEFGLVEPAFVAYSNLAEVAWWVDGPEEGLRVLQAGIDFAERRGLRGHARWHRESSAGMLFDIGRWDELLDLAAELRASGGDDQMIARTYAASVTVRRGPGAQAAEAVDEVLTGARRLGDPYILGPALTVAALFEHARRDNRAALSLIDELSEISRDQPTCRAQELADAVRVCVRAGDLDEAESLVVGAGNPVSERHRCSLATARATLAEARGDLAGAARAFERVAERWAAYGHRYEHAQALLGLARCHGESEPRMRAGIVLEALGMGGTPPSGIQRLG